ncbi:MAG: hypothetical protein LBF01_00890 [Bacteroidales bacterium]|jgi:hypothetical protein|nr:hypothetical protein [Bacteroidales bacterium]
MKQKIFAVIAVIALATVSISCDRNETKTELYGISYSDYTYSSVNGDITGAGVLNYVNDYTGAVTQINGDSESERDNKAKSWFAVRLSTFTQAGFQAKLEEAVGDGKGSATVKFHLWKSDTEEYVESTQLYKAEKTD